MTQSGNLLAATGQKDQINWNDPLQGDWLGTGGGFRWGIPGAAHTEIKLIGQILNAQMMKPDDLSSNEVLGLAEQNWGKPNVLPQGEEYAPARPTREVPRKQGDSRLWPERASKRTRFCNGPSVILRTLEPQRQSRPKTSALA